MKFAWPVPGRVTVTESALKKGSTAKMKYDLVLSRQANGKNMELKYENFQFLELNGIDLTTPEAKEKYAAVTARLAAMQGAMPTLVINPEGLAQDVIGIDQMIENSVNMMPTQDPKEKDALRTMMQSPQMVAQLKEKTKDFWRLWVQTWLNYAPAAGQSKTFDMEIPMMTGVVTAPLVVKNEGAPADKPGFVKMTADSTLAGKDAEKAFGAMMQQLVAQVQTPPNTKPFSPDMIKEMKRTTKFVVVTNPSTMQPAEAKSEIVTELAIGEDRRSTTEKHDYSFDWPSLKK